MPLFYYICKRFPEGTRVSSEFYILKMIDKNALREFVEQQLEGTEYFLVDIEVSRTNEIKIEIDSKESVDIDFCIQLSHEIEKAFPREPEDYELEVGSAGLTSPFKVLAQYEKNLGNKVEVLTRDGRKLRGVLSEVTPESFSVETKVKVKHEGAKRPVEETRIEKFGYDDVKSVVYDLEF